MKKNHWIAASALACMLALAPSSVEALAFIQEQVIHLVILL